MTILLKILLKLNKKIRLNFYLRKNTIFCENNNEKLYFIINNFK